MSNTLKLFGVVAVVALLVTALGATVAFAQGPDPRTPADEAMHGPIWGGEKGPGFGRGAGPVGTSLVAVAAEQMDMTVQDLVAELQDGKTIAQVGEEKGISPGSIVEAYLAPRAERLEQAVADGRITQEQADQMLATMQERIEERLNSTFTPRGDEAGCCGEEFTDQDGDGTCDNYSPQRDFGQGHGRGMRGGSWRAPAPSAA